MNCLVYNIPNFNCELPTVGGLKEIWIQSRDNFGLWYYNQTSNFQFSEIIGNEYFYKLFYKLSFVKADASFTHTEKKDIKRIYEMGLNITYNAYNLDIRDNVEQLETLDNLVVVFKDYNNRYFLMGETFGCKAEWEQSTDTQRGRNSTSITFTCRERYPIRQLSEEFVNIYVKNIVNLRCFSDYDITQLNLLTVDELNELIIC